MDRTDSRRIVVGVSGSLGSLTALHVAVQEADRSGADLLGVLAWEPPGGEIGYRRSPCPPLLDMCRRQAEEQLRNALDAALVANLARVQLNGLVVRGRAADVLVRIADQENDMLVVGSGSRGLLRRALRPAVARYCLAHASCPVLVVPPSPLLRDLQAVRHLSTTRQLPLV